MLHRENRIIAIFCNISCNLAVLFCIENVTRRSYQLSVSLPESGLSLLQEYDVIIAGAGIVGASIAWHAARDGLNVAVIDASGPAAAATGASDGAVSVASKRPGIMADLAGTSLSYCRQLARQTQVLNGVFHTRPSFLFARNDVESDALDRLAKMLLDQDLPVGVTRDGAPDTSSVAGLSPKVLRMLELSGEGHMLGYQAVRAFLSDSKARCHWPCRLEAFEAANDQVTLQTSMGEMRAARLVLAAGMGSASLLPDLPLIARSGQLAITDRTVGAGWADLPGPLTSAAYLLDKSTPTRPGTQAPVVIDPLATGQLLIGSSREDGGSEAQTDFHTLRRILASAAAVLPALTSRRIIRVFAGVRTASGDSVPIVGELPDTPNVILATGFEGDGICLAPLIGREVAGLLGGQNMAAMLSALSPARFSEKKVALR
jgi:glycine/D-amino acid oxidase-like deaminating enzyme